MNRSKFFTTLATLGPIGYLQAPGTWGSVCALFLIIPLNRIFLDSVWYWPFIGSLIFLILLIINKALAELKRYDDPQEIVLDEVAGMLVAFAGVPVSVPVLILGFLLFRLFDIFKPFGISYLQNIAHSSSVVLDDLAAGLLVSFILSCTHLYGLI